jgi:hypothetical protein
VVVLVIVTFCAVEVVIIVETVSVIVIVEPLQEKVNKIVTSSMQIKKGVNLTFGLLCTNSTPLQLF